MDQTTAPEGWKPLPLKPEIQAHIAAESVVHFIVLLVVGLRFFSRSFLGAGLGIDDLMIFFAVLTSSAVYGLIIALQISGAGYPQVEAMNNLPTILLMTFVLVPHYLATLLFSKVSMLTFYLRVFETHKLRIWALSTIGVCVAWFIAHLLANIFICSPVEAQWKMELLISGEGVCQEQVPLFQSMIITNMLIDLIIMALPLKTIWSLQMRLTEKIALMASFLLLGAVIIVGSVRVHYVSTVNMREDLTMTMPISLLLTTLEPNFAILCVSIPTLRPLYRTYRERYGSSRGATKLSDQATPNGTIGGSGAKMSRNRKASKTDGDNIALFNMSGRDKFNTSIEAESAQSLDSEASAKELTSHTHDRNNK